MAEAALPALVAMLDSCGDPKAQATAADALAQLAGDEGLAAVVLEAALAPLARMVHDGGAPEGREAAAGVLLRLGWHLDLRDRIEDVAGQALLDYQTVS